MTNSTIPPNAETNAVSKNLHQQRYAIYKYHLTKSSEHNLFYSGTDEPTINHTHEIMDTVLKSDLTFTAIKRNEEIRLKSVREKSRDDIHVFIVCNTKDLALYEGKDRHTVTSHPGSYVIVDNRDGICQIAIEDNDAFTHNPTQLMKSVKRTLARQLHNFALNIEVYQKKDARKFWDKVNERRLVQGDTVKRICFDFPNTKYVKGVDCTLNDRQKEMLDHCQAVLKMSNALRGQTIWHGSKQQPLLTEEENIRDMAELTALCAQNGGYNMAVYFHHSKCVSLKKSSDVLVVLGDSTISDFIEGQTVIDEDTNNTTFRLQQELDNVRKDVAGYNEVPIVED